MGLKLAAAVIFTVIGGCVGGFMAERLDDRRKRAAVIRQLLVRSAYCISGREDDVYEICRRLRADDSLSGLDFIAHLPMEYSCGENFHSLWQEAVDRSEIMDKGEREIVSELGQILGSVDKESQLDSIRSLELRAEELRQERGEQAAAKGRLYRSAGILFGVMAGIMAI